MTFPNDQREDVTPEVELRHCTTLQEYEDCVRLEHLVWGEDVAVPSGLFAVARHTGGQAIAAFGGPEHSIIGFVLALVGQYERKVYLHSHMAAVLPEYQNRGIGRRLKLFQRDDALQRGIDLIEWTFDPLETKNAHFNFMRLGAVARRFVPNFYGITGSPLHSGLPTDRLVAEWWLDSERVKAVVADRPLPKGQVVERIALPSHIREMKTANPEAALDVQSAIRTKFLRNFAAGMVATTIESHGERTEYLLEDRARVAGLELSDF